MAQRNQLVCPSQNGNVAVPECLFDPGFIIGTILVRKGRSFTPQELTNLRNTLATRSQADNRRDRIFIIGRFVGVEDKSTEASTEKFGYGDEFEGNDGRYKFDFRHRNGFCYHQSLMNFNDGQNAYDALLIDNAYTIIATERVDADGKYVLGGLSLSQLKVPNFKFATGDKSVVYTIKIALADSNQLNKYMSYVVADFDPFDVARPLADIKLLNMSPTAPAALLPAGQFALELQAGCGSASIAEMYATELVKDLFVMKNAETGGLIPVSALSKAGKKVTLTLDTTSPNYPALVGGQMVGTMVLPSALATAGIAGYEAGSVTLTRLV